MSVMKRHCAPACFSCDYLTVEGRCPLDDNINEQNVWKSGDLDEMFEKLILQQEYESTILSRPPDGPWLVQLDGVLSAQEALEFIELGAIQGYEASGDVGSLRADGTAIANYNEFRTSTNSWCLKDCSKNTTISNVMERLSSLISIPPSHSEHLQLLKYQPNQFYRIHHDYIEHHVRPYSFLIFHTFNDIHLHLNINLPFEYP
jgi:prolyl 4-hydroxylase